MGFRMGNLDCPFGADCERSKVIETEIVGLKEKISAMDKHLTALTKGVRLLQFIVIGGWLLDFLVKNGQKAQAMTLAFMGR